MELNVPYAWPRLGGRESFSARGNIYKMRYTMKKTIGFVLLLLLAMNVFSQEIGIVNGKYYKADMLYTGLHQEFYDTGELLSSIPIVNGDIDGIQEIFYPDGTYKERRSYAEGLKNGTWMKWNVAGVKVAEANYRLDLKHGEWKIWDDRGTLRYLMVYRNGRKTDTWIMYNENGEETGRKKY